MTATPPTEEPEPPGDSEGPRDAGVERTAVLGLALLHFLVLGAWYVLRPLRDEFATVDPALVPVLWRDVFLAMLVASPVFAAIAGRVRRGVLVPGVFGLFAAVTLGFAALFGGAGALDPTAVEHAFYVACGVIALFAVSVFWSFAADLMSCASAARWFGPVAAAGTLGQGVASFGMGRLRETVEPLWLLVAAAALFGAAALAAAALDRWDRRRRRASGRALARDEGLGGGVFAGLALVFRSRYLFAIVVYIALMNTAGAVFYVQQSEILRAAFDERAARGAYLADVNLAVSALTLLGQAFLNAWLLARIGVGATLMGLPVVAFLGLSALGLAQWGGATAAVVLGAFTVAEVTRRAVSFALAKPTREVLFTLVSRNEKYRSKNFIDTAVYRGVDVVAADGATWLRSGGLALHGLAFATLPLMAAWAALALGLGALAKRRGAGRREGDSAPVTVAPAHARPGKP